MVGSPELLIEVVAFGYGWITAESLARLDLICDGRWLQCPQSHGRLPRIATGLSYHSEQALIGYTYRRSEGGLRLSTALEATVRKCAPHFRLIYFLSWRLCGVSKGFTIMVANHARKKLARQLIANSEHPLSYTEAMAHASKMNGLRRIRTLELTAESKSVIARASRGLMAGSDLVIFGLAGTGKSTAAYSLLEEMQLRSLILTSHYLEAAYLRSYLQNTSVSVKPQHLFAGIAPKIGAEVVLVDELRRPFADQGAQLSAADRRIVVVHARTMDDAQWRLKRMLPELELKNPSFIKAELNSGKRSLRLYEPSGYDRLNTMRAQGIQVELSVRRGDYHETISSATNLEDTLTALRFAHATMSNRHRELEIARANGSLEIPEQEPTLMIMVDEAEELLSQSDMEDRTSEIADEARKILGAIARQGREVAVKVIVGASSSSRRR